MYSNLFPFNFCARALRFKLRRQMRYIPLPGFVCKSFCRPLSHKVSLSWLPCSAAEKQMGEQGQEGARWGWGWGGVGVVCEWDAHWPCHHHKPPVWSNILTGWMSGWFRIYRANSPPAAAAPCFSINSSLHAKHTKPNQRASTTR